MNKKEFARYLGKLGRFYGSSFKINLNCDQSMISNSGWMMKKAAQMDKSLNKEADRLGAKMVVELGYEDRKLD